ncbi:MAG: glycoside hydrolase family 16 protein [Pseudomonadota bacterium]
MGRPIFSARLWRTLFILAPFFAVSIFWAAPQMSHAEDNIASDSELLNLTAYKRVFTEDFDDLDVSDKECDTRWIAHTPYNGDFGDARFANPTKRFPFRISNSVLRIEASKDYEGNWESGLLSSQNPCGTGYTQLYGYFESRIKLPAGEGVWPAFWFLTNDQDGFRGEIDAIEFYGHAPKKFQSAFQLHPLDSDAERFAQNNWLDVDSDTLTEDFNLYGVSIEEDFMTFYFNRKPYWQVKTPDEFKQPWYILVNLALGSGYSIENTPSPSYMYVDYIHAYQKAP